MRGAGRHADQRGILIGLGEQQIELDRLRVGQGGDVHARDANNAPASLPAGATAFPPVGGSG